MTAEEIRLRRLYAQHLLEESDTRTVVRNLCGVQAQFLSHALHSLSLRSQADTGHLIKSWTIRGTMHLFDEDDLPLFLHEGRSRFLRPQDTLESDAWLDQRRKAWFSEIILDSIGSGYDSREELKHICRDKGMTHSEESSLFDPWGGIIRALCEEGRICHRVSHEKSYRLCPDFTPMECPDAQLELTRRYFSHFGPATIKDAAYFLGWTQKEVKAQLSHLNVNTFVFENGTYFHVPAELSRAKLPHCLFLAGFDQLMLGYDKKESIFLEQQYMRQIFTMAGIVRPALLIDGTAAGYWNLKNGKLTITLFRPGAETSIREAAEKQWLNLKKIEFA